MAGVVEFIKNSFFLQWLAGFIVSKIPAVVEHNLGKYHAIKKAFYLTGLEQLDGDYLEFGVFTGSSFIFAMRSHVSMRFLGAVKTRFFGFDSFSGFGDVKEHDRHPFYIDNFFRVDADRVINNIKKKSLGQEVNIVKGYFEESIKGKVCTDMGVSKTRIVFIDCDLKDPARLVLDFVRPGLQSGAILLMDDYYSYRGNSKLGVAGAFAEFCADHPELEWRRLYDYGYGGIAYILSSNGR